MTPFLVNYRAPQFRYVYFQKLSLVTLSSLLSIPSAVCTFLPLVLEAEIRFEATFEDMQAKLEDIQKALGRTNFTAIDTCLRQKKS